MVGAMFYAHFILSFSFNTKDRLTFGINITYRINATQRNRFDLGTMI